MKKGHIRYNYSADPKYREIMEAMIARGHARNFTEAFEVAVRVAGAWSEKRAAMPDEHGVDAICKIIPTHTLENENNDNK